MSEEKVPRVAVALPGGRTVDGQLHARRKRADGSWWYLVAIDVPAAAVRPIDGEDYDEVPTTLAEPPDTQYVVDNGLPPINGRPRLELHVAGCWNISQRPGARVTPVPDAREARTLLRFDDTVACQVCRPEP